jgi:hypothetical protein
VALICHGAYQRFGVLPSQIMALPLREQAFLLASDLVAAEHAEKAQKARK